MIRTPRPGRRSIAALATVSSAAALAVLGGAAPSASAAAESFDASVCADANTHFFLNNVNGTVEAYAYYSVPSAQIYEASPSTVRVTWHKRDKHVIVSATEGLVPLGGFKQVASDTGLVDETNLNWTGTIRLRRPPVGTGYWLCGNDPGR